MKNIFLTTSLLAILQPIFAQNSWDGTYRLGDPDIKESSLGILQIKQLSDKEIRFSLQFSDHNLRGNVGGQMSIDASKTAIYFSDGQNPQNPCSFILQWSGQEIFISQESSAESCGFSPKLDISGTYHQISKTSYLK